MAQQSMFDDAPATKKPGEGAQPKKPVATIHIDKDDRNADWIKWRSRESELAIHDKLSKEYERKQKIAKAKRATIEARAAVLNAKVDKATKDTPEE